MLILYRIGNPFVSFVGRGSTTAASEDGNLISGPDGHRGETVRGRIEGAYHDRPRNDENGQHAQLAERFAGQRDGHGPVMQPSRIHNEENEWRET